ncbi:Protoheme IX farnesyltransferase, mitochondrial, partial [Mucuna pruriens]
MLRRGGSVTSFYSKFLNSCYSQNLNSLRSSSSSSSSSNPHLIAASTTGLDISSASASKATTDLVSFTRHYGKCYWELSKARLSMLVVATSGTGFVLGSGSVVNLSALSWTCLGTMMVAASANSLNQVFEINNDAKMKRTSRRPLPSGRITMPHAVGWASSVGLAGTALLATQANMLAAGLAASNLILYAFVYTPLKQIHPVNTWVGAVVGAIPPLLGWAAASNDISLNGMILPAALYFWQIPHFMALAYLCRDDYAAGGFKMYSLADPSGHRTALSTALTLAISAAAFSFYRDRTKGKARRMFHASLLYLPVFMSGLLIHRQSDNQQFLEENAKGFVKSASSVETLELDDENSNQIIKARRSCGSQARPPVAYASVAPFPFLPAPSYNFP